MKKQGFDFVVVDLSHPRNRRSQGLQVEHMEPFTRSDKLLSSNEWGSQVIGKHSDWISPDSPFPHVRRNSEMVRPSFPSFSLDSDPALHHLHTLGHQTRDGLGLSLGSARRDGPRTSGTVWQLESSHQPDRPVHALWFCLGSFRPHSPHQPYLFLRLLGDLELSPSLL